MALHLQRFNAVVSDVCAACGSMETWWGFGISAGLWTVSLSCISTQSPQRHDPQSKGNRPDKYPSVLFYLFFQSMVLYSTDIWTWHLNKGPWALRVLVALRLIVRGHTAVIQSPTDPVQPLEPSYQCSRSCVLCCVLWNSTRQSEP